MQKPTQGRASSILSEMMVMQHFVCKFTDAPCNEVLLSRDCEGDCQDDEFEDLTTTISRKWCRDDHEKKYRVHAFNMCDFHLSRDGRVIAIKYIDADHDTSKAIGCTCPRCTELFMQWCTILEPLGYDKVYSNRVLFVKRAIQNFQTGVKCYHKEIAGIFLPFCAFWV